MSILVAEVMNRWSHTFEDSSLSAEDFYTKLQKVLEGQQMPNTTINRATHKEGGMFSSSREYLRVKHRDLVFDICAAPFGKNFFISWWLYETAGTMQRLLKNTKVGDVLKTRAANKTFFEIDSEQMFRECVHDCVMLAVTAEAESKGFRQLTDAEKQYKEGGI